MIKLHDFSIGYGERTLLCEVETTIEKGRLTALIGRNGTGKSTLLRAIAGLNRRYTGRILLDGHNAADMRAAEMARTLAFVTTERTRIANLKCKDVVAIGRAPYTNWIGKMQEADKEIVMRSLASVGMEAYAERTMDKMSDGECQRIMIARALAQDTSIILLDEPTSFLDMPNRYELCTLLARLAHDEGKCILFSTHELDIALSLADAIALIDPPRLSCLPTEEMRRSGCIERLFRNGFVRNRKHIHPSRSLHWTYELSILRNGSQTAQHRFVTDTCDRRGRERHELGAIHLCLHSLGISGQRIEILRFQVTDNFLGFLIVTNLHSQYIFHLFQRSISFFCNVVKSSNHERVIESKDFRNLAFVGIKRPTNGLTGIIDSG